MEKKNERRPVRWNTPSLWPPAIQKARKRTWPAMTCILHARVLTPHLEKKERKIKKKLCVQLLLGTNMTGEWQLRRKTQADRNLPPLKTPR